MDGFIDWAMERVDEVLAKSRRDGPDAVSELQPIAAMLDSETKQAIARAQRLGTYEKIDRRRQYESPERAQPGALLNAVNVQGNHIRALQSEKERMQRKIDSVTLKLWIVSCAVAAEFAIIGFLATQLFSRLH